MTGFFFSRPFLFLLPCWKRALLNEKLVRIVSEANCVNADHRKPVGPSTESPIPPPPGWGQSGRAGELPGEPPRRQGSDGEPEWISVWALTGRVGGFLSPLEHLPANALAFRVPPLAAVLSAWWEATRGVCVTSFWQSCARARVLLLNFRCAGEVLPADVNQWGLPALVQ